jgi:hypothetical protein
MQPGIDYEILPDGKLVFTAHYLKNRGYCCGFGCRHCPYNYINVQEPDRSKLLAKRNQHGTAGKGTSV